ncbi:unnamed protein product [Camellia sinensis]
MLTPSTTMFTPSVALLLPHCSPHTHTAVGCCSPTHGNRLSPSPSLLARSLAPPSLPIFKGGMFGVGKTRSPLEGRGGDGDRFPSGIDAEDGRISTIENQGW